MALGLGSPSGDTPAASKHRSLVGVILRLGHPAFQEKRFDVAIGKDGSPITKERGPPSRKPAPSPLPPVGDGEHLQLPLSGAQFGLSLDHSQSPTQRLATPTLKTGESIWELPRPAVVGSHVGLTTFTLGS